MTQAIIVRKLGLVDYQSTFHQMQQFTAQRQADTCDEIWSLQHPPVFTLGRNTRAEHIRHHSRIPEIAIDRGGQVTYHGPGQLVIYLLLDLTRRKLGVRKLVDTLENAIISLLDGYGIKAYSKKEAPGVYVEHAKIAALGFRIKHGCSYHGLSLNVDMDLSPYQQINPCGYPDLAITDLSQLGISTQLTVVEEQLLSLLTQSLR